MEKKQDQRRKNSQCPTCGKYLSNDVIAMRKRIDELIQLNDNQRLKVEDMANTIALTSEKLKQSVIQLAATKVKVEQKDETIVRLESEIKRLKCRNLWQRIFNL